MTELNAIVDTAKAAFSQAQTPADLENAKALFLGKSGRITELMKGMAALSTRKEVTRCGDQPGQTNIRRPSARRLALADAELQLQLEAEALDVTARTPARPGWIASVTHYRAYRSYFWVDGFSVAQGPELSRLVQLHGAQHAGRPSARSMHDTFYVGWQLKRICCGPTPVRCRYVTPATRQRHQAKIDAGQSMPEIRVICPGRTYRVDSDATHSPMFHQCEGLWIGENVSFKDLKFVFTDLCRTFFERDDLVLRFRPSFFPFTEPSAEIDIQFQSGPLAGRWLEVAGSGQVHPNVVRNMGLDPEKYIGFAFGMGLDRFTMLRYGVNDLRLFFDGDIRFLSQFQ